MSNKQKINTSFIDYLRQNQDIVWYYENTNKSIEIVPKGLTHSYLLNNFEIDYNIFEYYCLPTSNLLSDAEFQKMVNTGYLGKKETALHPYSVVIYGAYYSRTDLIFKLSSLKFGERYKKINGKVIEYFTDLIPYFKEYTKGFQDGFNEFDNRQIKPYQTMFAEEQDYINKVFEYLTKNILFVHSWAGSKSGFTTNQNEEIINAFKNGQIQGFFYRAWSIVFSNNNLFAPLFQEFSKSLPHQQNKPETVFSDFFNLNEIEKEKIDKIYECFNNDEGKYLAALIHLLKSKHNLIEIIPSSKDKSLKKFHVLLTSKPKKYEAVRKCFDEKHNWRYTDHDEQLVSIEKRLNKILAN